MNFRGKIPRASDTARSYDDGDPRADSAARRKVLEEKRAKQAEARAPQGVSAGGGERGGTVAISINGIAVGEVSALDLVPQGSVSIRATPLKGKLSLEIEGTASGTGSGGGPVGAPYVTTIPDPDLTNEQVLTDGAWIEWDLTTPNVVVADIIAGSITTTEMGGDVTTAGKDLLTDATAADQRTTLGLVAIASSGSASDLTSGTVATARLGSGVASAITYLRGDQTWALLPSLTVSDGDKGDITVSSTGSVWTIDADVVTYAKMQNVSAASKILGRGDSGSGDVQEITLGTNLTMSGTTLNASGGGGTWTEANINFGATPTYGGQFTVTDAAITGSENIVVVPSGNAPIDLTSDEWEFDGLMLAAKAGVGEITVYAVASPGPISGSRKILYQAV